MVNAHQDAICEKGAWLLVDSVCIFIHVCIRLGSFPWHYDSKLFSFCLPAGWCHPEVAPLVKVESFLDRICMEHILRYVQHSTESLEREVSKIWMHGREKVSHMNDQVTQAATSLWHNLCKPVVDERVGSTITYRASATLDEIWRSAGVSRRRFKKFKEGFSKIFFFNRVPMMLQSSSHISIVSAISGSGTAASFACRAENQNGILPGPFTCCCRVGKLG